ncbi:MAG: hypothetical protein SFT92_04040 [Rickettsiales bacterium]|nr:hypothetical protein [Rickettsiales bacterium]
MILPLGATSSDTGYPLPTLYGVGYGYGGRIAPRQTLPATPPVRTEVQDTVSLSPAAQRILDQAERLTKISIGKE